jgi:L-2-hydroxyglutarate oxidase
MTDVTKSGMRTDVAIVGGGIVGLATAMKALEKRPGLSLVVLEKESKVGAHQTGNNSGVLHSGIYYKPGSLKAENCRNGKKAMEAFCADEQIPYDICGKVIVALSEKDLPAMQRIYERGQANGVACELIDEGRLKELEPHTAGIQAIWVPEAGIVDYRSVVQRIAEKVEEAGGEVKLNSSLRKSRRVAGGQVLMADSVEVESKLVVNCAGLQSDRVARLLGQRPDVKIVPFRGEYYELTEDAEHLCNNLIYPVPDPAFPFLGVHFTRMIQGGVECGPNAVLAFAREGYTRTRLNPADLIESLTYPGFLRLARKYWKTGFGEMWRSFSKSAFVKALQRLVPEISADQLIAAPAGVRAQALNRDGSLVDDFLIEEDERVISVLNAPSPAATSALNIGSLIADRLLERV